MRRPVWLGTGVALGVGGTLWLEHRIRRGLRSVARRVAPESVAAGARSSVAGLSERVREAIDTGRSDRDQREEELWRELAEGPAPRSTAIPLEGGRRNRR